MTRCDICGRAGAVGGDRLPLAICSRARCRPERADLENKLVDAWLRFGPMFADRVIRDSPQIVVDEAATITSRGVRPSPIETEFITDRHR